MKKLLALLATATLAFSTITFAEDANNDVLKSIPDNAVVADAGQNMANDAADKKDGATEEKGKHHKKCHCKHKNCKHKHHHNG